MQDTTSPQSFDAFVSAFNLPVFVPVTKTCEVGGFSRTTLYELNKRNELTVRKIGGKAGVLAAELYAFMNKLPAA
jgi:hypothetical protein